jgi:hypothetical protein
MNCQNCGSTCFIRPGHLLCDPCEDGCGPDQSTDTEEPDPCSECCGGVFGPHRDDCTIGDEEKPPPTTTCPGCGCQVTEEDHSFPICPDCDVHGCLA